ncbi:proto-oncogene FRAT1-like [Macrotis lagotis]|uniref:proto-oncogene FRAT1-like n=1 Tax=Macrotis lagotis TaxID=92651 RepID=UPI003D6907A0
MPCRRDEDDEDDEAAAAGAERRRREDAEGARGQAEGFLQLQRAVAVGGAGDVDRLVARIGEALRLDAAHGGRGPPRKPPPPGPAPGSWAGDAAPRAPAARKRGFPQPPAGPCRRAWLRGAAASRRLPQQHQPHRGRAHAGLRAREDDPHQLLQQLVLSGNLIKEAVRRLRSRSPRPPGPGGVRPLPRLADGILVPSS